MTKNLLKIKIKIDKILDKLEKEALDEGINLLSPEFTEMIEQIKNKILIEAGVTLDEFDTFETAMEINPENIDREMLSKLVDEIDNKINTIDNKVKDVSKMEGPRGLTGLKGERGDSLMGERGLKGDKGADGKNRILIKSKDGRDGKDGKSVDKKELKEFIKKEIKEKDWKEKIKDIEWRIENINTKNASFLNRSDAGSFNTAISDSRYFKKADTMSTVDHGTDATDEVVNVSYGTGDPPTANTTTIGSLFIKYTA